MVRYSVIEQKNCREIVLLRGSGCKWRRCRFCDYHLDFSKDEDENYLINRTFLNKVTGKFGTLEVINSGSFVDLDDKTMKMIEEVCVEKNIKNLHFECHWKDRQAILALKEYFKKIGITVKIKIGVETFDFLFRESYLDKGIDTDSPSEISQYADEVCLLFGIPGQNAESMINDVNTGLKFFERVCINIMVENSKPIKPDPRVREVFMKEVYPVFVEDSRVDILIENTDFGVGYAQ